MYKCPGCPFNDGVTEEATAGQNYGCLPQPSDMIHIHERYEVSLSCHERQHMACVGLSECVDTSEDEVCAYSDWYHGKVVYG